MTRVLALDPGSQTGASWGDAGGKPKSRIIRIDSKMSAQRRFCMLEDSIRGLIALHEIDDVAIESRYTMPTESKPGKPSRFNPQSERLGRGWETAIVMACEREGIGSKRVHLVSSAEWRKTAFSGRRPPKTLTTYEQRRDWWKGEAILLCGQRGWGIGSDDESEANLIWLHACEMIVPRSTERFLPLFDLCHLG
jgi:hypothetical protein